MASLEFTQRRQDDGTILFSVTIPRRRNGGPNTGCANRVSDLLLTVSPAAFDPHEEPMYGGTIIASVPRVVPHAVAEAMQRDLPPPDDDEGIPGEPPRCSTGGCAGD